MPVYFVKKKYRVFHGTKEPESEYRPELSELIKSKFGVGPYTDKKEVRNVLVYTLEYFIEKFKATIHGELSLDFYRNILWFHEQATELAHFFPHQLVHAEMPAEYIASYRRILKMILEEAIEIDMICVEEDAVPENMMPRIEDKLNHLLFLGDMILMCTNMFAEQDMVEDVAEVITDEKGYYVFKRKHHYEAIFNHIKSDWGTHLTKAVVDDSMLADFKSALKECIGVEYDHTGNIVGALDAEFRKQFGWCPPLEWELLPKNLSHIFGYDEAICEQYYRGLTLNRSNKMDLFDLVCKPYKINRYLYRPILIWSIEGRNRAFLGKNAWAESINQLDTNAIPWGKAPEEWMENKCFADYVHSKEDDHDKWLDDAVEVKLESLDVLYDRNVTSLKARKGSHKGIDIQGVGEVDFIIVVPSMAKIFISDCKHLLGRYDMVNQKNDYNAFTKPTKKKRSYNQSLADKLEFFEKEREALEEHFKIITGNNELDFSDYTLEGIFIINSPTFYMHNSEYRIYTIAQIESVLKGEFTDPEFMVYVDGEDQEKMINVKYPYFKKPKYVLFDPYEEDIKDNEE
ncbi:MAG: hypothetical protein JKX76_03875 [Colwellia sp.]|nr:hypothetical protein [Colwellia sp.]